MLLELLQGLFTLSFNIISFLFSVIVAFMIGMTMASKGRNGLLWGIAGFFFPYLILVTWFIPAKQAKLNGAIRNHPDFAGKTPIVASIMALSAMVAKSDGHVSREEVKLVRNFIQQQFRLSIEELNSYEGAFNYGKDHPEDYEYFTDLLGQYRRYNIVTAVSYLFVGMSVQDDNLDDAENLTLRRILTGLGLHEYEYQSIRQHYTNASRGNYQYSGFGQGFGGYQQGYQRSYQQSAPSAADLRQKYTSVLGVDVNADMSTIKKAYRKLAKENHPDKMTQDGMPEGYVEYANQKISEINEAYEWLKNTQAATA